MDTTPQYIKMCKDATEIQDQWKFEIGDYITRTPQAVLHEQCVSAGEDPVTRGFSIVDQWWLDSAVTKEHLENGTLPEQLVWLPRQDQMQEMLSDEHRTVHKNTFEYKRGHYPNGFIASVLIDYFHPFYDEEYDYIDYVGFDSMEQLWLAYLMDHKYEKRWTGIKWISRGGE